MFSKNKNSPYSFILALVLGAFLAVGFSAWATSLGTNVSVTGTLTVSSATASSSITTALGVGTTTPSVMFSVGGAAGNATGHGYFTGGLGVGIATTTAGAFQTTGAGLIAGAFNVTGVSQFNGNVIIGDTSADTLTITSNSVTYITAGTSTIPST